MQMTRRKMLGGAALIVPAAALALAGCTSAQIAVFEQDWTTFVQQVQSVVNEVQSYIPTIESVAATMAALFGPEWAATVALTSQIINEVIAAIESALGQLPASARVAVRARLRASAPGTEVTIGTIPGTAVVVSGYRTAR